MEAALVAQAPAATALGSAETAGSSSRPSLSSRFLAEESALGMLLQSAQRTQTIRRRPLQQHMSRSRKAMLPQTDGTHHLFWLSPSRPRRCLDYTPRWQTLSEIESDQHSPHPFTVNIRHRRYQGTSIFDIAHGLSIPGLITRVFFGATDGSFFEF